MIFTYYNSLITPYPQYMYILHYIAYYVYACLNETVCCRSGAVPRPGRETARMSVSSDCEQHSAPYRLNYTRTYIYILYLILGPRACAGVCALRVTI